MELPPPSPSNVASSFALPVVETSDGLPSPAVWDWGNLLDFAIEADDSLILRWDSPDLSRPASPRAPMSDLASPEDPVPVNPPANERSSRARKRDPRLVCANYLAGRVPCACPELDAKEMEEDEEEQMIGGRKRARAGVVRVTLRCQVRGCEADIQELKGYHRRHRVCLQCANASSVLFDGEERRYCQQCGKFHVLIDFDEDKRSCRRKLERHNRRRRRKPTDSNRAEIENLSQREPAEDVFFDTLFQAHEETPEVSACLAVDNGIEQAQTNSPLSYACQAIDHGLEQAQTNSSLSFPASANARIDGTIDPKSAFSSTICDNKTFYSSVCPTGRISFKLYDWNPAEFPRRLRHQIFQWLASMPVELEGYIRPGCTILTIFIAMPQHMWEKLSQDGALFIKQLINLPESLFMERGNILINLNNMIIHVLIDGTLLIKREVEAPRLHFVHPTYFEAGKMLEFTACGNNLDRPKLRFLVSFAGKYMVCNFYRVISHPKVRCDDGIPMVSSHTSQHEMFRIIIKETHPEIFGPAFIEVENESGLSNFIPILIGNKQICSELENLQGALTHRSNVQEDKSLSSAIFDKTPFSKANVAKQIDMADLLLDIAWLLKKPCKDCNKSFFGSFNVQRLKFMLLFSLHYELISVLKAILKYVSIMIHELGFLNSDNLAVSADLVQLLQYMETARDFLNQRTQLVERSKLYSEHSSFMETSPVNHVENIMIIMPGTNPVKLRGTEHDLVSSTSPLLSVDSADSASHVSKHITRWLPIFTMCASVMCFLVCIILFDSQNSVFL